ncbi:unnamed protein product, partial [Ectocarpus sp. 13 AM-2016]
YTILYRFFYIRVLDADSGNPIEGMEFIPSLECKVNLEKHRLLLKKRTGGLDIYYQENPEAASPLLAPIKKRTKFGFGLVISDPDFFSRYDPDLNDPPQLYFDNLDGAGALLAGATEVLSENSQVQLVDTAKIYAKTFSVATDLTVAPAPTSYSIKEKHGPATLQTVLIDNSLGTNQVTTKLNDPIQQAASYVDASGPYLLESDSGLPATSTIYLDDQL